MWSRLRPAALAFLSVLVVPASAVAGDGRVEINQSAANAGGITPGDSPGLPVSITRPGSYVLTGDLEDAAGNRTLIRVTAAFVDIDLNGFSLGYCWRSALCGGSSTGFGIIAVDVDDLTVRNGSILNMAVHGIAAGARTRVDQVRAIGNRADGVRAGPGSQVTRSFLIDNGDSGVHLQGQQGGLVADNVFRGNGLGLTPGGQTGYRGNVFTDNNDGDERQNNFGGIDLGGNVCGTDTACP